MFKDEKTTLNQAWVNHTASGQGDDGMAVGEETAETHITSSDMEDFFAAPGSWYFYLTMMKYNLFASVANDMPSSAQHDGASASDTATPAKAKTGTLSLKRSSRFYTN